MSTSILHPCLRRMFSDRGGNFGIMTAILAPVLLGAAGMAIQVGDMLLSKQQLQEAADSAALATATALANGTIQTSGAEAFARNFVAGQMANYLQSGADIKSTTSVNVQTTTSGKSTSYQVTVSPSYDLTVNPLMQAVGFSTQHLSASGTTVGGHSQTQGSISMYLALDKSGSMGEDTATVNEEDPTESYTYDCNPHLNKHGKTIYDTCTGSRTNYYTKIEALKIAAGNLFGQLSSADPNAQYVRTGAVSYDIVQYTPSSLAWGTAGVSSYVNALQSGGGTNSSGAMSTAYSSLTAKNAAGNDAEDAAHKLKTGQIPKKYIVFMTDGDNNNDSSGGRSYDTLTKATCDTAKSKGIEIYTIAFMAPAGGQTLLHYCASDDSHYFQAEKMEDLLAAFKAIGAKASAQLTRLTN
ncbi:MULTISPECIES: TadE/TadG family type IV pilus assembly protein [Rhizobium]|uniref:TadE/TadG family type IV pilus assembly protein n=1 Tax=Rhizobium TaxID=379 RepID=UPI001B319209|nr:MULTISPECIES: TadE/TadG family type IV pilus assembly protein [Rhizobium]MBX4907665.1 VWA domain-containing protein [Rhizobium bangladeshense]MBX5215428.1 VWA domain-containing protein [Rhizobium sp. NLR9a]MBX5221247.1 VWA domain-containing protein [Rhizobium sp. NLR8a]MBX5226704.1 VWA domain-containing protein [Rhizobium sp. NLR9b]MBX5232594.1 VWA domain-containing protein [Rhizobium sp. NLR4a]